MERRKVEKDFAIFRKIEKRIIAQTTHFVPTYIQNNIGRTLLMYTDII